MAQFPWQKSNIIDLSKLTETEDKSKDKEEEGADSQTGLRFLPWLFSGHTEQQDKKD